MEIGHGDGVELDACASTTTTSFITPIMSSFSGALRPKKKYGLQSLASALGLNDQGTKDEIQTRIKKHLDENQADLEEDSRFAGLYGSRRRRGSKPPSDIAPPPRYVLHTLLV